MSLAKKSDNLFTIGEVLNQVRAEFTDISISKIRFLEAEGLIIPARTKSGYRKFSQTDVEKLEYILRMQRDHYLPLRVIKQHIEAMDRGLKISNSEIDKPKVPSNVLSFNENSSRRSNIRVTREEIIANTGISETFLKDAEDFGLIKVLADNRHFDEYALRIARVIAALSEYGIEPRHLKNLKSGTDREVSLIKQIVSPLARSRRTDASEQAQAMMKEIANLTNQLHSILVHHDLDSEII